MGRVFYGANRSKEKREAESPAPGGQSRTKKKKKKGGGLEVKSNTPTPGASMERTLQLKDRVNPERGETTLNLPSPQIRRWMDSTLDTERTP